MADTAINSRETPVPKEAIVQTLGDIRIDWKEELKPLGVRVGMKRQWTGMDLAEHIGRLYERCDALLERCEQQEHLIVNLMRR